MKPHWLNWRIILVGIAILLVSGTIIYSQYVAGKIAREERKNVEAWVEAQRTILNSSDSASINLATKISTENSQIPIIETNEKDSITGNYLNLDTAWRKRTRIIYKENWLNSNDTIKSRSCWY
jgi:hypothetical protein